MELIAPSRWRCVDFISDLHLQATDALTFQAWSRYLRETVADAVFILGDLFEVWVGDDVLSLQAGFEQQCADVLRQAGARLDLHIMQGNRDFLMGMALMKACNATLLEDPSVLTFANQRWLLAHGDALCLDDEPYMEFRAKARSTPWQQAFLDTPLLERIEQARALRAQSVAYKPNGPTYATLHPGAVMTLMQSLRASHMIHGHTHRPAKHRLEDGCERLVLSDWDVGASPPRAEVLRLRRTDQGTAPSFTLERIPPAMAGGLL